MMSAEQALAALQQGNQRYVAGESTRPDPQRRQAGVDGQAPFAVVIGCSDSRVPVELVFNQDVGDLFTIRVAGNIATPTQTGTVEYAVEQLGTRLVVVLGHTNCGAVTAAVDTLQASDPGLSPNLAACIDPIRVAVAASAEVSPGQTRSEQVLAGVRANVRATVRQLRDDSESLRHRMDEDGLRIVGAQYALETGAVTLLD